MPGYVPGPTQIKRDKFDLEYFILAFKNSTEKYVDMLITERNACRYKISCTNNSLQILKTTKNNPADNNIV